MTYVQVYVQVEERDKLSGVKFSFKVSILKLVMVVESISCLLTVRKVFHSNSGYMHVRECKRLPCWPEQMLTRGIYEESIARR